MALIIDKFLKIKTPTLRICMLGPRAVGKTTVLTSVFADTQDDLAGTGLFFRYKPGSESAKLGNYKHLLQMCIEKGKSNELPATGDISQFDFEVGYSSQVKTNVLVKDYPGEYVTDEPKQHFVTEFLSESHVVLIAIDTPYLMEDDGKYNSEKNKPETVTSFVKNNPNSFANKLILLVPLKCERYAHDKRIDEVSKRVKEVYSELITFCKENNVACVVAPIHTLGGIEFDTMKNNDDLAGISMIPQYRMYATDPKYKPRFCVQPMYYLMLYAASYSEWSKEHLTGIWARIQDKIARMFTNDDKFKTALREMRKNLLTDKFGYEILTTNSIFKF